MPGPHVDKIYQEAENAVNFAKLGPDALQKLNGKELEEYNKNLEKYGALTGADVFNNIESSTLTPEEKQEVHLKLVQMGVNKELNATTNPGTLLRGNSTTSQHMTAYMNKYAADYLDSVAQTTMTEVGKIQLPKSLNNRAIRGIGAPIEGVPPEDMEALDQAYVNVARTVIQASENNLAKLTPEAQNFLLSALAPLQGNQQALESVVANTLLLRGANPIVVTASSKLEDQNLAQILRNSSVVVQTYANRLNSTTVGTKNQDRLAEQLAGDETMKSHTKMVYGAVSDPDSLDVLIKLNQKSAELMQRSQAVGGVEKVEDQLNKLNKSGPSMAKLKAKLSDDGIEGTKRKLAQEVRELKNLGREVDGLTMQLTSGSGLKDRMGFESVLEVPTPTPPQTTTVQPEKDDLKQHTGTTQPVTPEKSDKGIEDLDLLLQEIAVEVEQGETVTITTQDVLGEVDLTPTDLDILMKDLEGLEEKLDQELREFEELEQAVTVEDLDQLMKDLETTEINPSLKKPSAPKPDVTAFDTKIQELQKERQRFDRPNALDRIKAFFKHGPMKGVQGERDKLDLKIEATKAAKEAVETGIPTQEHQMKINELKNQLQQEKFLLNEQRGILVAFNASRSFNLKSDVSPEQAQQAYEKGSEIEKRIKEMKQELKHEEKVLTVREKLGMEHEGPHVDAPRHKLGVK